MSAADLMREIFDVAIFAQQDRAVVFVPKLSQGAHENIIILDFYWEDHRDQLCEHTHCDELVCQKYQQPV